VEDATVQFDADGWIIGNNLIRYSIGMLGQGQVGVRAIEDVRSGRDWSRNAEPDSSFRVNGRPIRVGGAGSEFSHAEVSEWWGGVRLDLHLRVQVPALEVIRSYVCYPGSSVIETWTSVTVMGKAPATLSDLESYALSIENGTLQWITGMQTPDELGGQFTRAYGDLADGQVAFLGSDQRASETMLPWFSVRTDGQEFFGSVLWSGSWQFRMERRGDTAVVRMGLPPFGTTVAPDATLEFPHAIFGLTNAAVPDTALALRAFIDKGLRHGRPLAPYLTSNTWYSYGTYMNEESMLAEMEMAASVGMEQFVVDAGWWADVNWDSSADFVHNWGTWQVDYDRFPNGLGGLADRAHQLGMRFGVWVEPERVDRSTVGVIGHAQERFLATNGGRYDPGVPNSESTSAQVCLASQEARDWVLAKLTNFIDEVHPDYLKWDNNFWVNCTRPGHGHGPEDGNFQHHRGLQTLLDEVRGIYPWLDIENCASGGNRLSLDMLARTDAAWMDDNTGLSARTRHSIEGLIAMFPAPYLLSFSTVPVEGIGGDLTGDAPFVMRSRMLGAPGTSWRMAGMDDGTQAGILKEASLYKRIRRIQVQGTALLLGQQVPNSGWPGWDAVQYVRTDASEAVVMAFANAGAPESVVVHPRGLLPEAVYRVESADAGEFGTSPGAALMDDGIELRLVESALSHVVFLSVE
jgi:alpha-galactosidase